MLDSWTEGPPTHRLAGLLVGVLLVMAAGAAALDENRERFLQMSTVARQELAESLRRFDHDFRPDQQQAIRAIDDRLKALPRDERDAYFAAARRFHNWLKDLPERARDDLLARPPDQRMAAVKALVARHPLPGLEARSPVDFIKLGGTGLFEVASLCKVWLSLDQAERRKIDALPPGSRRAALHKLGREKRIPRELTPADFDERHWINRIETRLDEIRGSGAANKDWVAKFENRFQAAVKKRNGEDRELVRPFVHLMAVHLYVQEHDAPPPVDPNRLTRFFEAIPSWVQSTFNIFPADEARRRLTFVYRLVFPHPEEFDARAASGASPETRNRSGRPAAEIKSRPEGPTPAPPKAAPKPSSGSTTPF